MNEQFWDKFTPEEVLSRLASGRFPPVTTTVLFEMVFGKLTPELVLMVDEVSEEREDSDILRAIWGRNREVPLENLQDAIRFVAEFTLLTPAEIEALPKEPPAELPYDELPEAVREFLESLGGEK
jgi:uncharacterized protein (UPF0128 family)